MALKIVVKHRQHLKTSPADFQRIVEKNKREKERRQHSALLMKEQKRNEEKGLIVAVAILFFIGFCAWQLYRVWTWKKFGEYLASN